MKENKYLKKQIIKSYRKKLLFTLHATNQMNLPERMITPKEIREVIEQRKIIESYPDDPRGASYLLWGRTRQNRVLHVLCSPKESYLLIITAYIPFPDEWKNNLKERR